MPSAEWLEKISKKQNRESNLWRCFVGLDFLWRKSILEFLKWRNGDEEVDWSLYYIKMPQRNSRLTVSGHKHDNQLLQVIIFRREDPPEEKIYRTVSSKSSSSSERPQPKVSFAEGIMKRQNTKPTVISSREPLQFRNKEQILEAIMRLAAKKGKLDGAEPERIDEINDMIDLLTTQLQLYDTLSQSQRDIFYGDCQHDEYPGTKVESGAGPQTKSSKRRKGQSHVQSHVQSNARSHLTDRTEEIYIPRDRRNRLLEETDIWDNLYSPASAGELIVRQNSPKKSRSFERTRPKERPSYTYSSPDGQAVAIRRQDGERHRDVGEDSYEVPGRRAFREEEIIIRRDEREKAAPRRRSLERRYDSDDELVVRKRDHPRETARATRDEEDIIIRRDEGKGRHKDEIIIRRNERSPSPEPYVPPPPPPEPEPIRGRELVIRRDDHEVPDYGRKAIVIRERERSPTEDMAIGPKGYQEFFPSQRSRQLNERLSEQHKELEKLRLKEEILRLKEERATSRYDYTTASDLVHNAIPEIQAQIRRLEAQDGRRYPNRQISDYGLVEEYPYRQRSPPIRRTSTFNEDSWPSAASKALVLRTGGSRQPDDYLRERILDRSIRIRGEPEHSISPVRNVIVEAHRTPADSRQSSYSERDRRHVSRRPTPESDLVFEERSSRAHGGYSSGRPRHRDLERVKNRPWRSRPAFSSSEDDDYRPTRRRTASKQRSGPSNEELITQTLKRFTTFQGDQPPAATQTSLVDTSSRQPINAQKGDIVIYQGSHLTEPPFSTALQTPSVTALGHRPAEASTPLGLGTLSEEPGAMAEGTSPQSPIRAPSYPSTNGSPPQPGALPPPPLYTCPICKPQPGQAKRQFTRPEHLDGHLQSVHHVFESLRDHRGDLRAASGINEQDIPPPSLPRQHDPSLSDFNVDYVPSAPRGDSLGFGANSPTKPTPTAGVNGQPKATKEPRTTEVSDESSEDGVRRLRKEDRKATVEDLEPDQEAGQIDPGVVLYD